MDGGESLFNNCINGPRFSKRCWSSGISQEPNIFLTMSATLVKGDRGLPARPKSFRQLKRCCGPREWPRMPICGMSLVCVEFLPVFPGGLAGSKDAFGRGTSLTFTKSRIINQQKTQIRTSRLLHQPHPVQGEGGISSKQNPDGLGWIAFRGGCRRRFDYLPESGRKSFEDCR